MVQAVIGGGLSMRKFLTIALCIIGKGNDFTHDCYAHLGRVGREGEEGEGERRRKEGKRRGRGKKKKKNKCSFTFLPLIYQLKNRFCYKMDGMLTEWAFKTGF